MVADRRIVQELTTLKGYSRFHYHPKTAEDHAFFMPVYSWVILDYMDTAARKYVVDIFLSLGGVSFELNEEGDAVFRKLFGEKLL